MTGPVAFHHSPAHADPLPIAALGFRNERFWFRTAAGEERYLSPPELLQEKALVGLFGGERWLRENFPARFIVVAQRCGGGRPVPVGIDVRAAAWYLSRKCADAQMAAVARGIRRVSRWTRFWTGVRGLLDGSRRSGPQDRVRFAVARR